MIRTHPTSPLGRCLAGTAWLGAGVLLVGLLPLSASAATTAPAPAPLLGRSTDAVSGQYIVVLKDDNARRTVGLPASPAKERVKVAVAQRRKLGGEVKRQYTTAVAGYAATLSSTELAAVRKDPAVAYVQPNQRVYRQDTGPTPQATIKPAATTKNPPSWGLDRIDQRSLPLDKQYYATATGAGVTAFVVDTGLEAGQPDFAHVGAGLNFTSSDSTDTNDCNGHGTHVSGTIGGHDFGVAKSVTIVPIRVFGCGEDGATTDTVVAGLDAAIQMPISGPKVMNMSLGDVENPALEAAVQRVIDANITVVVAAGNENASACAYSPAGLRTAITVGATTSKDKKASFSNYASCVDLYAPGTTITSDWLSEDGDWMVAKLSGTSMATPHVTGTVAMYLQRHPTATPAEVQAALIKTASVDKVTGVSSKWPRLELLALQRAVVPVSVTKGNKLHFNQSLVRGNKLCSKGGDYCVSVETNGQLVLRKVTGTKKIVWRSGGRNGYWTRMTSTGALSTYDAYARRVWTSKKTGGKATLYVIATGYLKIVRDSDGKTLWTSR